MKWFNKIEEAILGTLLVSMTLIVFAEVVLRKMGYGLYWAGEMTLIINSWMVLIGASYCVREKAHICVDFVINKLPRHIAKPTILLAVAFCLLYCGLFLHGSWVFVREDKIIGIELDDIPLQTWIPASVLVVGFALLLLRFLIVGYEVAFRDELHALSHKDEAQESMELADQLKAEMESELNTKEVSEVKS